MRINPINFRPSVGRSIPGRQASPALWVIVGTSALSLFGSFLSGSPIAVLGAGASLICIVFFLWRPNDIPVFFLPIAFQWSQVAIKPILSVIYRQPVDHVLTIGYQLQSGTQDAALFGLAGVACLAVGIWLGVGRPPPRAELALREEAQRWNGGLVMRLALGAIVLGRVAAAFSGMAGPAYQIVLALSGMEYAGLFAFAYWSFVNRTGYRYLIAIMGFEILAGLTGFFADFRLPVIVLAIATLAARPSFRLSSVALMLSVATLILLLATFWSEIKYDYRKFVNEGSGGQVALRSMEARLTYIYDAAANFDSKQFEDGFNKFLARHSYIDFLGATMNYVPSVVPHEEGRLVGAAVANMVMPRILFPDKPPLPNDTDITSEYTGINFYAAGDTSISIGYLGELYIDFGYGGALFAVTIVGFCIGFGYRLLRSYDRMPRLINYGSCVILAVSFMDFGTALIKSINGTALALCAAIVVQRIVAPRMLSLLGTRRQPRPVSTVRRR